MPATGAVTVLVGIVLGELGMVLGEPGMALAWLWIVCTDLWLTWQDHKSRRRKREERWGDAMSGSGTGFPR